MKAQLYLDVRTRNMLKEPFEIFSNTYEKRIVPVFSSIEEESKTI